MGYVNFLECISSINPLRCARYRSQRWIGPFQSFTLWTPLDRWGVSGIWKMDPVSRPFPRNFSKKKQRLQTSWKPQDHLGRFPHFSCLQVPGLAPEDAEKIRGPKGHGTTLVQKHRQKWRFGVTTSKIRPTCDTVLQCIDQSKAQNNSYMVLTCCESPLTWAGWIHLRSLMYRLDLYSRVLGSRKTH